MTATPDIRAAALAAETAPQMSRSSLTVSVVVSDRGPSAAQGERYEAELAGYAAVRATGASPWEAVRALVGEHRSLLERRWAPGGPAT
jgi:hypothetical protein